MSIPYVSEEAFHLAQEFESRIRRLPPEAGIIFVGVSAVPCKGGKSDSFDIVLGIDRKFEEATGQALLRKVFEEEIKDGELAITGRVFRGTAGAAGDATPEVLGTASA
jgi:hypothetical protein